MRKITILASVIAVAGLVAWQPVQAEEGGMLEISGNIVQVTGVQRARAGRYLDTTAGVMADGLVVPAVLGAEQFGFFVDQVEIDLAKSFGENLRFRADLDFFPFSGVAATPGRAVAIGGGTGDLLIEQAYVTANVPAGNGWEFLAGRFNSGIGLDPIDRNELSTVSFSSTHRLLLPHNLTGVRMGYDWTDQFRWEMYAVNSLADNAPGVTSAIPSLGFNAVYTWGEEGDESWFKFSGAGGPEDTTAGGGLKKHWSMLGDLAVSHAATEAFRVGVEGAYRQDNATTAATDNGQHIAGTLQGTYSFSDVWDGTLRYGFTWDLDADVVAGPGGSTVAAANNEFAPGLGGALTNGGVRHDFAVAAGYAIADGCRFGLEGRFDLTNPSVAANGATGQNLGLAGTFAYNF